MQWAVYEIILEDIPYIMDQYFNEKISYFKDKEYENIIKRQVQASKIDAEKDGVVVPVTMEEYCMKVW